MIATTIEQSKHLLELGLDPATADMVWMCNKWLYSIKDNILNKEQFTEQDTLAWSLGALLEVMPYNYYNHFSLCQSSFAFWDCVFKHEGKEIVRTVSTNKDGEQDPISAAYEMVVWLLENGYIEKGGPCQ